MRDKYVDNKEFMTGQLISRGPYPGPDGRPVWILLGIVCSSSLTNGTQYTIATPPVLGEPVDREQELAGHGLSSIIRLPIWRV